MYQHFDLGKFPHTGKGILENRIDNLNYYNLSKHKFTNFTSSQKFYITQHFKLIHSLYKSVRTTYTRSKTINGNFNIIYKEGNKLESLPRPREYIYHTLTDKL